MAPISGSSLTVIKASPDDSRIDDFFFGDEPWAREIEEDFKSRGWEEDRDLFLFLLDEELVAGARLSFWNRPHPHRDSAGRAKYYLILSFGVAVPYQHQKDPADALRTFASVILDFAETTAREHANCVGMSLHVREENARARRLYEKHGFVYEAGSFVEDGAPTLEMRKIFD